KRPLSLMNGAMSALPPAGSAACRPQQAVSSREPSIQCFIVPPSAKSNGKYRGNQGTSAANRMLRMYRDGPLSRRPPEEIRYGTGKSALGQVLVALSDKGIVSIVVRSDRARLAGEIRERF